MIDDACQFAWIRLLHHRDRVARDRAVSWLITTALHEVFKLVRRAGHDLSLEQLLEETDDLRINRSAPAPEEAVGARLRLELLRELPERQERLHLAQGARFRLFRDGHGDRHDRAHRRAPAREGPAQPAGARRRR